MLKGMEQGRYVLRFPDVLSTWICAGLGGTSQLCLPVIVTALLAPVVVSPAYHLIMSPDTKIHDWNCHLVRTLRASKSSASHTRWWHQEVLSKFTGTIEPSQGVLCSAVQSASQSVRAIAQSPNRPTLKVWLP